MSEPQDPHQGAPYQPPSQPYPPQGEQHAYSPQTYSPQTYSPRTYVPPAYSPPAYGPPPESAPPPGGWYGPQEQWLRQQPPPPPSPSGRRTAILAAVVVVVLAVTGIGTWLAVRGDSSSGGHKKYTVPTAFDGYSQLHSSAADRVDSAIRSMGNAAGGGVAKRIFDAATIGVYSHDTGDQPVLIALIVPTSVSGSQGGDDVAREMLAGAVPDSSTFPSGSHGGSTRCGTATFGVAHETMCAWSDAQASGLLVSVNESMTAPGLAAVTQSFRDASE